MSAQPTLPDMLVFLMIAKAEALRAIEKLPDASPAKIPLEMMVSDAETQAREQLRIQWAQIDRVQRLAEKTALPV